jgi:hypothetical protein
LKQNRPDDGYRGTALSLLVALAILAVALIKKYLAQL